MCPNGNCKMDKTAIDKILQPGSKKEQASRAARIRAGFWKTVRKAAAHIPFMEDVVAAYFCAFDPATPARVRGILLAALAYFVMPFDFIPDMLAVIGFSDDIAVLTIAIAAVRSHITEAHRLAARKALSDEEKPEDKIV